MEPVGGGEAGEGREAERADPRDPLGRCRAHVPAENRAAQPAWHAFEFELSLESFLDGLRDEPVDRLLEQWQRCGVGPGEPREKEPIVAAVAPVDRQRGHVLGTRGQPLAEPAREPATERRRLAGHEGVGFEEDCRPADADGSGVSGGGDRVELHQSIDGKEGDIKREDRDVVHTAAAGGER